MALHTYSAPVLPATGFPELRCRRARLRAPRADDADRLFALFSDAATMRWWPRAPMRTPAEAEGYVEECAEFFARGDRIDWIVADARDDAAIGTCTLHGIDVRSHSAEIGYALLAAYRGRGIATEAVAQVIAWSQRTLGMARIEASVARGNVPSRRLLEGLGFVVRGSADADGGEDGVERWVLDALSADQSRRSAGAR